MTIAERMIEVITTQEEYDRAITRWNEGPEEMCEEGHLGCAFADLGACLDHFVGLAADKGFDVS